MQSINEQEVVVPGWSLPVLRGTPTGSQSQNLVVVHCHRWMQPYGSDADYTITMYVKVKR